MTPGPRGRSGWWSGTPPGASTDAAARLAAEGLTKVLGQSVVVDNQAGATGTLAVRNVMRAAPDGYTLLFFYSDQMAVAPSTLKDPPYDSLKDVTYVGTTMRSGGMIVACRLRRRPRTSSS